jgi:1-deoxy-D-xylulose-5-phosphate reductoisomerase
MRIPIAAALLAPERVGPPPSTLDLMETATLTFEPVARDRFPSLDLAYEAGRRGDSYPAVLNAANEEAVARFLDDGISFRAIAEVVEDVLEAHTPHDVTTVQGVLEADAWARETAVGRMDEARVTS